MNRRFAQPRGFTLLELVVVMLVVAVAMAIVAPSFRGFADSSESKDAAAQLVAVARWARSQAVAEGRVYRLNIDANAGTYWLTAQNGADFVTLGADLGRTFNIPEGSHLALTQKAQQDSDTVDFYPNRRTDVATISLVDRHGVERLVGCPSPMELFTVLSARESMTRPAQKRRAFTLLEVLATLVLMGIVLPVAMKGVSLATAAAGTAKRDMEAASLAESKLNELVATGQWNNATLSGDFGADWPGYRWTAQSTQRDTSLQELMVQVLWKAGNTERSMSLTTLVYTNGTYASGGTTP